MGIPTNIINKRVKSAKASGTGAQTDKEIVAAPGAGKRLRLVSLVFSSSVATDLTIKDGTPTTLFKALAVTSVVLGPETFLDEEGVTGADNKNLRYDTTAGNSEIRVEYTERG